jgi:UDP-N-acetylglucosamine 2-epimerase (non-hydrolysing)
MNLIFGCKFVITDSGGIQEETTYLKIPCLTLRANTERSMTITQGTNKLSTPESIEADLEEIMEKDCKTPPLFYHRKPGPLGQVTVQWFYHLNDICYSKAELLHNLTKE